MLTQNRPCLNQSNLLFPDGQYQTGGGNCEMSETIWQVLIFKAVLPLKKKKLISPIKLHCTITL